MPHIDINVNYSFYETTPKPIVCRYKNSTDPLVLSDESSIWVNEDAFESYGIKDFRNVKCCYTEIIRRITKDLDDNELFFYYGQTCKEFWKKETINVEFIRINCSYNKELFYNDYHFFVPIKQYVEERCKTFKRNLDNLNVLILGLDSVSRLNFHRTMKNTLQVINDLVGIEMLGYNTVAVDTLDNLVPVLSGMTMQELNNTCCQNEEPYFDSCKFIWKDFIFNGYHTAFVEDSTKNAIFENTRKGFYRSPTDYYSPTFYYAAENDIGSFKGDTNFCIGPRLLYETLLNYVDKFVHAMSYRPYFGFFWQKSLTSNGFDLPFLADDSYSSLIRKISTYENFNKTVLVLMSDNGYQKFDGVHKFNKLIQIEEHRPLLIFIFPSWFRKTYLQALENLKKNRKRLVTPFDIYETLKDLINYSDDLNDDAIEIRTNELNKKGLPRAISLFLPISEIRTCKDAGIPSMLCTCDMRYSLNDNHTYAKYFAGRVIVYINKLLSKYPQCAKVTLNRILDTSLAKHRVSLARNKITFDCRIVIETSPGNMTFEAAVDDIVDKYRKNTYERMVVLESHHTISTYQNYSKCVKEKQVKPFCYCKS